MVDPRGEDLRGFNLNPTRTIRGKSGEPVNSARSPFSAISRVYNGNDRAARSRELGVDLSILVSASGVERIVGRGVADYSGARIAPARWPQVGRRNGGETTT